MLLFHKLAISFIAREVSILCLLTVKLTSVMLLKTHVWCDFKTNTRVVVVVFIEIYAYAKLNAEMCDRLVVRDSAVVDIRWR